MLDRYEIYYDNSEVWIPEEKLYEVLYSTEVIYGTTKFQTKSESPQIQ